MMIVQKIGNNMLRIEPYLFYLVLGFSLFPFFANSTFPVSDAPAHLYNSSIIRTMLLDGNGFYGEHLAFNNIPVPNWACHIILSLLLTFCSPEVAEKCLIVVIFAGVPIAVRYAFSMINEEKKYLSLLAIPIAYNSFSGIGFYNFSLGVGMIFVNLGFFYRYVLSEKTKWWQYLLIAAFLTITFFCHLVPLMIVYLLLALVFLWWLQISHGHRVAQWLTIKTLVVIVSFLPSLAFVCVYSLMMYKGVEKTSVYLPLNELTDYALAGRPFQVFGIAERPKNVLMAFFYLGILIVSVYQFRKSTEPRILSRFSFYILLFLILVLLQYVCFPDGDGTGAYISLRLMIIFYFGILLLALVTQVSSRFILLILPLVLATHFSRLFFYEEIHTDNNRCASNIVGQSAFIEPYSFVVPIHYDDSYLHVSYSNYLGLSKPVLSFFNYEASTGYFPLIWKKPALTFFISDCLRAFRGISNCKQMLHNRPIYYWVLGNLNGPGAELRNLKENLEKHCILINTSNFASLYKLR